jgi:hypothetical protein
MPAAILHLGFMRQQKESSVVELTSDRHNQILESFSSCHGFE